MEESSEANVLRRVKVRLIRPEEREEFDQILREEHHLHSARLGGKTLRYVAELEGQWVGLITFSGATPHVKAREKWIGWNARQRARRLSFIVNNSRLLIRTERQRYPNLASRVLGQCLRRLEADWKEYWGESVLVVESFVDESRYRGTCYRACGFEAVGATSGYGRSSRDYYVRHDQPKQLYLRELHKGVARKLRLGRLPKSIRQQERQIGGPCRLQAGELRSLLECFTQLKDPRRGHGLRHPQGYVLSCAAVAMLMGAGGYEAMEEVCSKLTQRQLKALGARYNPREKACRAPSDSTFFRVLDGLDPLEFDRLLGLWMIEQDISILESLAVDGKVLRGSGRTDGKPLQLLSAVTHRLRLTVAQEPIEEKSNEIPALKPLLSSLPVEGSLISADAIHCQQESARFITQELGADYLFGLKGNQSGILERAQIRLSKDFFSL